MAAKSRSVIVIVRAVRGEEDLPGGQDKEISAEFGSGQIADSSIEGELYSNSHSASLTICEVSTMPVGGKHARPLADCLISGAG